MRGSLEHPEWDQRGRALGPVPVPRTVSGSGGGDARSRSRCGSRSAATRGRQSTAGGPGAGGPHAGRGPRERVHRKRERGCTSATSRGHARVERTVMPHPCARVSEPCSRVSEPCSRVLQPCTLRASPPWTRTSGVCSRVSVSHTSTRASATCAHPRPIACLSRVRVGAVCVSEPCSPLGAAQAPPVSLSQ